MELWLDENDSVEEFLYDCILVGAVRVRDCLELHLSFAIYGGLCV